MTESKKRAPKRATPTPPAAKAAATKKAAAAKAPSAKALAAKKASAKQAPATRATAAKKADAKPVATSGASPKKMGPRADYGSPIDGFFAKQSDALRPILEELRALIEAAAPKATATIKWGMPFFQLNGKTLCALGGHKAHVNLILSGAPGTFEDPDGLLIGEGKTGKHLKLTSIDQLPRARVKSWLKTAVALTT